MDAGKVAAGLKPDGRLVVEEGQPDPHMVTSDELRGRTEDAGFRLERFAGGRFGYFSLLLPA